MAWEVDYLREAKNAQHFRCVLSADKTPHANKEEVFAIKSLHVMYHIIDHLMGQWAYELLMSF